MSNKELIGRFFLVESILSKGTCNIGITLLVVKYRVEDLYGPKISVTLL